MSDRATKQPNQLPHRAGEIAASKHGVVPVGRQRGIQVRPGTGRRPQTLAGPDLPPNEAAGARRVSLKPVCGVALDVLIEAIFGIALFAAVLLLAVSHAAPPPGTPTVSLVLVVPADRPAYYRGVSDAPMPSDGFNL